MSVTTTRAPPAASRRAIACPMPLPAAAVTSATRPAHSFGSTMLTCVSSLTSVAGQRGEGASVVVHALAHEVRAVELEDRDARQVHPWGGRGSRERVLIS